MNETSSAPGASLLPDSTGLITSMHLVLIGLFALLAVAIILIGMRKKHKRRQAEHAFDERVAEAEEAPPPPAEPQPESATLPRAESRAEPRAPAASLPIVATPVEALPVPSSAAPEAAPTADPLADEPIAAAAPQGASPAAEAHPEPAPTQDPAEAPVTQLKGLGPKVAGLLADRGITRIGQLAALSDAEATRLDADLGPFTGRLTRDRWLEQARLLAAGDRAGFEAVFGRL